MVLHVRIYSFKLLHIRLVGRRPKAGGRRRFLLALRQ